MGSNHSGDHGFTPVYRHIQIPYGKHIANHYYSVANTVILYSEKLSQMKEVFEINLERFFLEIE